MDLSYVPEKKTVKHWSIVQDCLAVSYIIIMENEFISLHRILHIRKYPKPKQNLQDSFEVVWSRPGSSKLYHTRPK